jgi:hypothetical protein
MYTALFNFQNDEKVVIVFFFGGYKKQKLKTEVDVTLPGVRPLQV